MRHYLSGMIRLDPGGRRVKSRIRAGNVAAFIAEQSAYKMDTKHASGVESISLVAGGSQWERLAVCVFARVRSLYTSGNIQKSHLSGPQFTYSVVQQCRKLSSTKATTSVAGMAEILPHGIILKWNLLNFFKNPMLPFNYSLHLAGFFWGELVSETWQMDFAARCNYRQQRNIAPRVKTPCIFNWQFFKL